MLFQQDPRSLIISELLTNSALVMSAPSQITAIVHLHSLSKGLYEARNYRQITFLAFLLLLLLHLKTPSSLLDVSLPLLPVEILWFGFPSAPSMKRGQRCHSTDSFLYMPAWQDLTKPPQFPTAAKAPCQWLEVFRVKSVLFVSSTLWTSTACWRKITMCFSSCCVYCNNKLPTHQHKDERCCRAALRKPSHAWKLCRLQRHTFNYSLTLRESLWQ